MFEPRAFQAGQAKRYSLTALLDPENPSDKEAFDKIVAEANRLYKEKWGKKKVKLAGKCFGDAEEEGNEDLDGWAGKKFIRLGSKIKPLVCDRRNNPVDEDAGLIYGGAICNVSLTMWAMDNKFGKRINGELRGVQFVRDGERFGSGGSPARAETEFEPLDDEDDEDGNDETNEASDGGITEDWDDDAPF